MPSVSAAVGVEVDDESYMVRTNLDVDGGGNSVGGGGSDVAVTLGAFEVGDVAGVAVGAAVAPEVALLG